MAVGRFSAAGWGNAYPRGGLVAKCPSKRPENGPNHDFLAFVPIYVGIWGREEPIRVGSASATERIGGLPGEPIPKSGGLTDPGSLILHELAINDLALALGGTFPLQ